ncbi:MAG TPA: hypothetical protein VF412_09385 [Bdellovibrio sp.]|uniref:hypothetical protein n=1 Tax=Bdellovibrio sp. TaxID=28201 RepID=UPI002F1FAA41
MNTFLKAALVSLLFGPHAMALTATTTFEQGYKEWQNALDISSTEINGEWKRTAVVEHSDCPNVMRGTAYNESGLENADHSVFTLVFEGHQVRFENVGSKDKKQGPYEVTGAKAQFSSWAYDESAGKNEITDQAFGEFLCRQTHRNKIICAVGARLKDPSVGDPVFKACSRLDIGIIAVFTKKE